MFKLTPAEARQLAAQRLTNHESRLDGHLDIYWESFGDNVEVKAFAGKRSKPDYYYILRPNRSGTAIEQLRKLIDRTVENYRMNLEYKQNRKDARKADSQRENPFQVGDMLTSSWGYEQTNRFFWQVVRVTRSSIVVREIAGDMVEATCGMAGNFKPVKDQFTSDRERTCRVQWSSGHASVKIDHGYASKVEEGRSYYASWYG